MFENITKPIMFNFNTNVQIFPIPNFKKYIYFVNIYDN